MILRVPNDPILHYSATSNPDNFIRDIACYPRTGIQPFIRRRKKIKNSIKSYENPFDPISLTFSPSFKCIDKFWRYLHLDLAKNGDAVGISMCHVPRFVDRNRIEEKNRRPILVKMPVVKFDFWGRIKAEKGQDIILADIREVIYLLSSLGFYIGLITFDRFQSLDSIQILRSYGYTTGNFSVDRTTSVLELEKKKGKSFNNPLGYSKKSTEGQYNYAQIVLRDLIYDDRLEVPALNKFYEKDYYLSECEQAQEVKGKIDHPPTGTIDVMQSMAGSATHAIVNENSIAINEHEQYNEDHEDTYYKSKQSEIDSFLLNRGIFQGDLQSLDPRDIDAQHSRKHRK